MTRHGGFTLVEVLVVLVLIAAMASVPALAIRPDAVRQPGWRDTLLAARTNAARTGAIVSGFTDSVGRFTAHPNGMIVTDSAQIAFRLANDAR